MGDQHYIKITVIFEQRPDGGLRAHSEDVPGFVLSGPDANAVFEDVIPALEMLLLHNKGMRTNLKPVVGLRESMERDGFLPPEQPTEIREYVSYAMAA